MRNRAKSPSLIVSAAMAVLMISPSAEAFRCGQKLVREKMHELEVRKVCGAPTTSRNLGIVTRGTFVAERRGLDGSFNVQRFPGYGHVTEQVQLTEYVYNFGPRKFMRRLLFEGGILANIESIGYGYNEKTAK